MVRFIVLAALAAGAGAIAVALGSDHRDAQVAWAVFGPAVGWSFVFTGLYAWRRRPESRIGLLMVWLGFAWFLTTLESSDVAFLYTLALVVSGSWGGVLLHLGVSFPSGRLTSRVDRALVLVGYPVITLGLVPALFFSAPSDLGCDAGCPENLLLIDQDAGLASFGVALGVVLYALLLAAVLVRTTAKLRAATPDERLQLIPVYVCALLTFVLVTAARAGAGEAAFWAAIVFTGLLPFAFLGSLLRTHVSHLDAELRESLDELRASRARLVHAGDEARRRLERDLHDGAQSRLVALAMLLRAARTKADGQAELTELIDTAQDELRTSLAELRELARGIHPAVLTERGLEPALRSLVARSPVPVEVEAELPERLPRPVESAAYFVVSEALANVAKYAEATEASVTVRRDNGRVRVLVADDGVGGADVARGSGLRGLADRLAALDGTLALDSPAGEGTRLRAEIPLRPA